MTESIKLWRKEVCVFVYVCVDVFVSVCENLLLNSCQVLEVGCIFEYSLEETLLPASLSVYRVFVLYLAVSLVVIGWM